MISQAVKIEPGINFPAKDIAPRCMWSGCKTSPQFMVSHPILDWVQTCEDCVTGFLADEVEVVTKKYRGNVWRLKQNDL